MGESSDDKDFPNFMKTEDFQCENSIEYMDLQFIYMSPLLMQAHIQSKVVLQNQNLILSEQL